MTEEAIARINELARLARQRELTPEEQEERQRLRAEYVAAFRGSLESHLNAITIVHPDGRREKLQRKKK